MSAARAARAFLAIGGRIMIAPDGKLVSMIDAKRLLARTHPNPEPSAPFKARRRIASGYNLAEHRDPAGIASLVVANGQPVNGWLVWQSGEAGA